MIFSSLVDRISETVFALLPTDVQKSIALPLRLSVGSAVFGLTMT